MRKVLISVIGGGAAGPDEIAMAREVGRQIARGSAVLVCGGLGGVMEAACCGAHEEGGETLGFLPGERVSDANRCLDIALPTGLGEARNFLVARASDGVVAVGGALGTLSELAFALKKRIPVAAIGSWSLEKKRLPRDIVFLRAGDAAEAVRFVFENIRRQSIHGA